MKKLLLKLQSLNTLQKEQMIAISKERCDDIHSIRRIKGLAESILELEVRIDTLKDVIVKIN